MSIKLSIVVPNYNEKENLERGVLDQMYDYLSKVKYTWEVIINDDGSTDGGDKIIENFVNKHKGFRMVRGKHGGKAAGIWNGIQVAKGDVVLFTDMDQSTPLVEAEKLLPWFDQGYDVVFGSRGHARENFNLFRQLTSWGFRTVRSLFILKNISDTQCGFKAFKTSLAKRIFPHLAVLNKSTNTKGWTVSAFDVELLFMAQKTGADLKEVPVIWKDEDTSTGKKRNFVKESVDMLKQIVQVKMNDISGKYDKI